MITVLLILLLGPFVLGAALLVLAGLGMALTAGALRIVAAVVAIDAWIGRWAPYTIDAPKERR